MKKYAGIFIGILLLVCSVVWWQSRPTVRSIASALSESPSLTPQQALKVRILEPLHLDLRDSVVRVQIGTPTLETNDFICTEFPTYDLVFRVEGVVISGDIPSLIVRVPCEVGDTLTRGQVVEFDLQGALTSPETLIQGNIQIFKLSWFPGLAQDTWKLSEIHFYNQDRNSIFKISDYDILSVWPHGLLLKP